MKIEDLYNIYRKNPKISIDSRIISKDCLFFALKGDRFNGNQFALKALEDGAAYAVIDEKEYATDPRCLLVDDTLKTLQLLANYHRKFLNFPILAITGTNGKTTTKELISAVLKQKYNTVYTQGNLNNHIGVPLTLLTMNAETEFGVVEMGANHQFEIKSLCEIAEPDYGLITNVGKAHLEGFGTFENIIKTKTELYDFLNKNNGVIFYNASNPFLTDRVKMVNSKLVSYGNIKGSKVNGAVKTSNPFVCVDVYEKDFKYTIDTNLIGNYNLENILAAVCIGDFFGIENSKIKNAIENYQPSNNRSQLIRSDKNTIYMDAYNANPTSIAASLSNFIELKVKSKCIILGDMLELGSDAVKEHEIVIKMLQRNDFKTVILVGEIYSKLKTPENYCKFKNVDQAISWLEKNRIVDSNILIKGSRGIKLEKIVEYL